MTKKYTIIAIVGFIAYLVIGFWIGRNLFPRKEIVEVPIQAPVMDRILQCESAGRQFGEDGQVLIKVNKNGSTDIGKYQINSVWNKMATKLGFNLTIEKDNESFAMWLYQNVGTSAWDSSNNCWK